LQQFGQTLLILKRKLTNQRHDSIDHPRFLQSLQKGQQMSHREQFDSAWAEFRAARGGEPNQEEGAMLYVLTSLGYPWDQIRSRINWARMSLPIEEFSPDSSGAPHFSAHEHRLVEIAWALYNPALGQALFRDLLDLPVGCFHTAMCGIRYLKEGRLPGDAWSRDLVRE
jgi:hypothetical protein